MVFEDSAHGLFGRAGSGPLLELLPKEEVGGINELRFLTDLPSIFPASLLRAFFVRRLRPLRWETGADGGGRRLQIFSQASAGRIITIKDNDSARPPV